MRCAGVVGGAGGDALAEASFEWRGRGGSKASRDQVFCGDGSKSFDRRPKGRTRLQRMRANGKSATPIKTEGEYLTAC
jgi:hypothetical protein